MGIVVKNHTGEVIISTWDYIGACFSVEEGKLRATLSGLYISITLHKRIILKTDCSFVASFLAHHNIDMSSLVDLRKETLGISKMMMNLKISKINKKANICWRMRLRSLVLIISLMVFLLIVFRPAWQEL